MKLLDYHYEKKETASNYWVYSVIFKNTNLLRRINYNTQLSFEICNYHYNYTNIIRITMLQTSYALSLAVIVAFCPNVVLAVVTEAVSCIAGFGPGTNSLFGIPVQYSSKQMLKIFAC